MKLSDSQLRRMTGDPMTDVEVRMSRLSRVTALEVIDPKNSDLAFSMLEEMERAWEKDWVNL